MIANVTYKIKQNIKEYNTQNNKIIYIYIYTIKNSNIIKYYYNLK